MKYNVHTKEIQLQVGLKQPDPHLYMSAQTSESHRQRTLKVAHTPRKDKRQKTNSQFLIRNHGDQKAGGQHTQSVGRKMSTNSSVSRRTLLKK